MPEYVLDTGGTVLGLPAPNATGGVQADGCYTWDSLDAFTQGYIEALFFTETDVLAEQATKPGAIPFEPSFGFSDLAPETLARIISDCAAFRRGEQWQQWLDHAADADIYAEDETAGRDFWYTRNGHGCGFWDGDWPEPYATQLTDAARAFGNVDAYLGDDGRVYL